MYRRNNSQAQQTNDTKYAIKKKTQTQLISQTLQYNEKEQN